MLTEQLKIAKGLLEYDAPRGQWNQELYNKVESTNSAIREEIISKHFGGRKSAVTTPSMFWVYADSIAETMLIKRIANDLGYKNMRTFRPWTGDTNNVEKRLDDPKGKYAVDIHDSVELVIGDTARGFMKLIAPFLEPTKAHHIFSYGHMKTMALDFNDQDAAQLTAEALDTCLNIHSEITNMKFDIETNQSEMDRWRIDIKVVIVE